MAAVKQKRALQKWFLRMSATKRCRAKSAQVQERYAARMRRSVFEAMRTRKSVNDTMAVVASNLERNLRTKVLIESWKSIKSYALSKNQATAVFRRRGAFDVASMLNLRRTKLLRVYFNRYKLRLDD